MIVHQAVDLAGDSSWLDRYDVYSREDCFDTEALRHYNQGIQNKFQPEDYFGNYKKDLRMIYYGREKYRELQQKTLHEDPSILLPNPEKDAEMLKNIVMVEEDSSYLFPGQEKNMLLCPTFFTQPYPYGVNYNQDDLPPENKERFIDDFKNTIPCSMPPVCWIGYLNVMILKESPFRNCYGRNKGHSGLTETDMTNTIRNISSKKVALSCGNTIQN